MSWEKYKKGTTVNLILTHLRTEDFLHINLLEQSTRSGVNGYRYVERRNTGGQWELGDTNTGRVIFPKQKTQVALHEEPCSWQHKEEKAAQLRELLCVVDV